MSPEDHLNPVFITAHPRSGTSLLYRTLLKHSSFAPKELCMEETRIFRHPLLALSDESKMYSLKKYMLKDEEAFTHFLNSIQFEKKWQKLIKSAMIYSEGCKPFEMPGQGLANPCRGSSRGTASLSCATHPILAVSYTHLTLPTN